MECKDWLDFVHNLIAVSSYYLQLLFALEDAASLQRICLNGPQVFSLLLSRLISNLSDYGVVPLDGDFVTPLNADDGTPSMHLKRSATLVTNAILSNGAEGLDMPSAISRWRCLRHLSAVTVAIVAKSG